MQSTSKSVHFVGIGGIGVSALARYYLAQKWVVSGSDLVSSAIIVDLKKCGLEVKIGPHKAQNVPKSVDLVVYTPAADIKVNLELKEAIKRGIPVLSYPEALSEVTRDYQSIAVSGTHGKSTTTALLSCTLVAGGLDPTVVVGTKLKEFGGTNFRRGDSPYFVFEADEYAGSFLHYSPTRAIITNIDADHLDYYKTFAGVKRAFLKFVGNVQEGGTLVVNKDDVGVRSLMQDIKRITKRNGVTLLPYSVKDSAASRVRKVLKVVGEHNVSNAMAAYTMARALGVKSRDILKGLGKYRGAWRRMELRGILSTSDVHNIPVYDDYAHHPAEVQATLTAFREMYPKRRIICVYQPHQARRLQVLFDDFVGAFGDADVVVLLPVYQVAGRDKVTKKFSSEMLAEQIVAKNPKADVVYCEDPKKIRSVVEEVVGEDDSPAVVVMMGAGTIVNYTDLLL